MRHKKLSAKLGRTSSHRKAMISNMITSLFRHERVKTTIDKAKEVKRFAEKTITLAKKDTLHARRLAFRRIKDEDVLSKLFSDIGPRFANRDGGYTRIIRTGHRAGDGAEMAYLELVGMIAPEPEKEEKKAKRPRKKKARKKEPAQEAAAAEEMETQEEVIPEASDEETAEARKDESELEEPREEKEDTAAEEPEEEKKEEKPEKE